MSDASHRESVYRTDDDDVVRLGRSMRRRKRLLQQQEALQLEAADVREALATLEAESASETRDVERLEARSLTWLLWSAVGQGEARLLKEREEALQAELRLAAKRIELDACEAELTRIAEELRALEGLDGKYEQAFGRKVRDVLARGGTSGAALQRVIDELHQANATVREIDEALEVGILAERHLGRALAAISEIEADEVAMMVVLTSVVMMSTGMDHPTRLEFHLERGQHFARRYMRELADVPVPVGTTWRTNFLHTFVTLVGNRGTQAARDSQDLIRGVGDDIRRTQAALRALRVAAVALVEETARRYRLACEQA